MQRARINIKTAVLRISSQKTALHFKISPINRSPLTSQRNYDEWYVISTRVNDPFSNFHFFSLALLCFAASAMRFVFDGK